MSQNKSCELYMYGSEACQCKRRDNIFTVSSSHRYSVNRPVETHMSGPSKNLASPTQVRFCLPYLSSELISRYKNPDGEEGGNSRFDS